MSPERNVEAWRGYFRAAISGMVRDYEAPDMIEARHNQTVAEIIARDAALVADAAVEQESGRADGPVDGEPVSLLSQIGELAFKAHLHHYPDPEAHPDCLSCQILSLEW